MAERAVIHRAIRVATEDGDKHQLLADVNRGVGASGSAARSDGM